MQTLAAETGLTITNPLVLYRALVATRKIEADPAQHRLALHLQKLYHRLKDYEPTIEYRTQLEQVTRTLNRSPSRRDPGGVPETAAAATPTASGRRRLSGIFDSLRDKRTNAESLALTRRLTSHEAALHLDSPQGLLLYGEVGTGKSMLVDLLADALPTRKKRRCHFNAFMLDTFARIEQQRLLRSRVGDTTFQHEHTLIAMARDMISTSPILFLDEFQLPDRASSKIISNLFTSFFQLGGVLIATSNRMPEELARASGAEFEMPSSPTSRLGFSGLRSLLSGSTADIGKGITSRQNDFTQFVDVLKARCETWNMESKIDFRRRDAGPRRSRSSSHVFEAGTGAFGHAQEGLVKGFGHEDQLDAQEDTENDGQLPAYYFQSAPDMLSPESLGQESLWQASILGAINLGQLSVADVPWHRETLKVYGRKLSVHKACNGTSMWTFDELCNTYLGPADYITLASTFHTLVLTDVPVLTAVRKNEARRFITLLDALYESRCRLLIRAEMGPDDLFFPDQRQGKATPSGPQEQEGDGVYAETLSEIYQDATNPFRPNVSTYTTADQRESTLKRSADEPHRHTRSILADEDADFGPVYGAGRSAGASKYLQPSDTADGGARGQTGPNFQRTESFTGQDERFAYKRAESRLWELCSDRWWLRSEEGDWWKPVSQETRAWEAANSMAVGNVDIVNSPKQLVEAVTETGGVQDNNSQEDICRHGASPFRVLDEAPPKLSWTHVWGMMKWGNKAGTWGKGADGVQERLQEKQREQAMPHHIIQTKPRKGSNGK